MLSGRAREMGLGSARDYSLAEAREEARLCRRQRSEGVDPIDARKASKAAAAAVSAKAVTFKEMAE